MNEVDTLDIVDESDDKFLTEIELQKLNENNLRYEIQILNKKLLMAQIRLIESEKETLKAKLETLDQKRKIADGQAKQMNQAFQSLRDENKKYLSELAEKYDLPKDLKGFGYDPDSGKIISD